MERRQINSFGVYKKFILDIVFARDKVRTWRPVLYFLVGRIVATISDTQKAQVLSVTQLHSHKKSNYLEVATDILSMLEVVY